MDLISIVFIVFLIYMIYTLIGSISSLQREVKEMKLKCIKEVHNNDIGVLEENSGKDPMKVMKDNIIETLSYLKNVI